MFRLCSLILLFSFLFTFQSCHNSDDGFVKINNGHFEIDGKPYYFIGTNFWYGAILASTGEGGDRDRLLKELDYLDSIGVNNLRILVGADGENGIMTRVRPTLQTHPGIYNDTIFDGLDFLLAEMGKREMYAVLYFTNSWNEWRIWTVSGMDRTWNCSNSI